MRQYIFVFLSLKIIIVLILLFGIIDVSNVFACEIEIRVNGKEKEMYAENDIVILEVYVFLTHKICPEGLKATKFKSDGMKILGATAWKEKKANTFLRMIKVEINHTKNGEAIFQARRTCDKEGGYGVIKLKTLPSSDAANK